MPTRNKVLLGGGAAVLIVGLVVISADDEDGGPRSEQHFVACGHVSRVLSVSAAAGRPPLRARPAPCDSRTRSSRSPSRRAARPPARRAARRTSPRDRKSVV